MTWSVRTTEGVLVKLELTEAEAKHDAELRNKHAEQLGIATRYEAVRP